MKLAGKCSIVTGGGAGIGRVYAQGLASEGAAVAIADVDINAAERTAADIMAAGGRAVALEADMGDEAQIERMAAMAIEQLGGVDILVNNAGLYRGEYGAPFTDLPRPAWRRLVDVNLTGPLFCALACRTSMKARGGGVIVNQSSVAAYSGSGAYGVTKLALNGLTLALANEFAPDNIRVNGIAPGITRAESGVRAVSREAQNSLIERQIIKRLGRASDLLSALLFLCSEDSSFITGQTLLVDGGLIRRV